MNLAIFLTGFGLGGVAVAIGWIIWLLRLQETLSAIDRILAKDREFSDRAPWFQR